MPQEKTEKQMEDGQQQQQQQQQQPKGTVWQQVRISFLSLSFSRSSSSVFVLCPRGRK